MLRLEFFFMGFTQAHGKRSQRKERESLTITVTDVSATNRREC
jgi:hypothetical protein